MIKVLNNSRSLFSDSVFQYCCLYLIIERDSRIVNFIDLSNSFKLGVSDHQIFLWVRSKTVVFRKNAKTSLSLYTNELLLFKAVYQSHPVQTMK